MNNLKSIFLLFFIVMFSLSFQTIETRNLRITVTNIRNDRGEIKLALFNKSDAFPNDIAKSYKIVRGKIANGVSTVSSDNIPYGQYAIGIYYDENNNNKLDKTWYGMPKEGVAVSNNASLGIFSLPKFETAKFNFQALKNDILIKIKYL